MNAGNHFHVWGLSVVLPSDWEQIPFDRVAEGIRFEGPNSEALHFVSTLLDPTEAPPTIQEHRSQFYSTYGSDVVKDGTVTVADAPQYWGVYRKKDGNYTRYYKRYIIVHDDLEYTAVAQLGICSSAHEREWLYDQIIGTLRPKNEISIRSGRRLGGFRTSLPNKQDLMKLPLRATVAFAARCACRAHPIYEWARGNRDSRGNMHPELMDPRVAAAISVTAEMANGGISDYEIAETAAKNAEAAADDADNPIARDAALSAANAAKAAGMLDRRFNQQAHVLAGLATQCAEHALNALVTSEFYDRDQALPGMIADYERLAILDLGSFPELGEPVDPSKNGPLGTF